MTRLGPDGEERLRTRLLELAEQGASLSYDDLPKGAHGVRGFSVQWANWYPRVSQLIRWAFDDSSDPYGAVAAADHDLDRIFAEPRESFEHVKDLYLHAIDVALSALGEAPDGS